MKKRLFISVALLAVGVTSLVGCNQKTAADGSFDFIIYESDADNNDLSNNKVVSKYHIEYKDCKTVTDALIKKESLYFFNNESPDYLVLVDSQYGLSYSEGYFANYAECANNTKIDVSYSYTAVNGVMAEHGIGETPLEGLQEYGFVINGWKQ